MSDWDPSFEAGPHGLADATEALQRSQELVQVAVGSTVVASEVVDDFWIRYTIRTPNGEEHDVGGRLEPLVTDEDWEALREYRALGGAEATPSKVSVENGLPSIGPSFEPKRVLDRRERRARILKNRRIQDQ